MLITKQCRVGTVLVPTREYTMPDRVGTKTVPTLHKKYCMKVSHV